HHQEDRAGAGQDGADQAQIHPAPREKEGGLTVKLFKGHYTSESLSAFVFRTDQVVRKTNTTHHSRLMPRRKNRNKKERLETSVCRSQNLSDTQVWEICAAHFDLVAPKPAIGRGVGPAAAVFDVDLGFDADGKPYLEHANIIGWYASIDTPDDELKHFWMDKAQKIAPRFTYVPRQ
ncbi:MAG: hypothetical protein ACREYE_19570, partial [Gammaproteobacteria bacterium]